MIQNSYELSNFQEWTSVVDGEAFLQDVAVDKGIVLDSIGQSYEGRELYRYTLGSGTRTLIITGGVHGAEPASREAVLLLARDLAYQTKQLYTDFLSQYKIIVIPTVNPDRMHIERNNRQGLNINRDFYSLETPEAIHLATLLTDVQPEIYIDFHERSGTTQRVQFINPMNLSPNYSPFVKDKTNELTNHIRAKLTNEGYLAQDYPTNIIGDAMSVAASSYMGSLSFTPETDIGVIDKQWRVTAFHKVFDNMLEWFMANEQSVAENLSNFNTNTPKAWDTFTLLNGSEEYYATATKLPISLPDGYQLANPPDFQKWIDVYNFVVDENGFIPINQRYGRMLPRLLDPESAIAAVSASRVVTTPEPEPEPDRRTDGRYTKVLYDEWREVFIKYM